MQKDIVSYFNKRPRIGTLSTSDNNGNVDVAIFGSTRMVDENTIVFETAKNRTFENLLENPKAVFFILEPGQTMPDWKGIRVYLKMIGYSTEGIELNEAKEAVAKRAGSEAAKSIYATVKFEITEVRPVVDNGQHWENTI